MEDVLPIIFIREVDVIEEEREVHEEPLGQVKVDGGALEEADMEHCFTNAPPDQNMYLCIYVDTYIDLRTRSSLKSSLNLKCTLFNPGHKSVENAFYE